MEGTSGAVDPGSLRGESGEASLGSGWYWSARAGRSVCAGRMCVICASRLSCVLLGLLASRKRVVRRSRRPYVARVCSWVQGLRGGIVGDTWFGFGRAVSLSNGNSSRCSRDLVTRGVRADRVGAKLHHRDSFASDDGARCRTVKAGRPLTREISAGAGWKRAACTVRSEHAQKPGAARIRRLMWRMGLHPFRRFPPSPAQAGRVASANMNRGIERSRGCARGVFWLQKSTRGVWSAHSTAWV